VEIDPSRARCDSTVVETAIREQGCTENRSRTL
jgi:hypothetical protein